MSDRQSMIQMEISYLYCMEGSFNTEDPDGLITASNAIIIRIQIYTNRKHIRFHNRVV